GTLLKHLPHTIADNDTGQRPVGTGQALGNGDQVRLDTVQMAVQVSTETAETTYHLIGNQQDIVLVQYRLDGAPVAFGRRYDTTGTQHRLTDEGRNGIRPFGEDHFFQLGGAVGREFLLAHAMLLRGAMVIIRRLGVQDTRHGQIKLVMESLEPCQGPRRQTRTMVATLTRDDLLLLRAAKHVVVVTHQLELGLVCVTAAKAIVNLGHAGACQLENLLGQSDLRLVGVAYIG